MFRNRIDSPDRDDLRETPYAMQIHPGEGSTPQPGLSARRMRCPTGLPETPPLNGAWGKQIVRV